MTIYTSFAKNPLFLPVIFFCGFMALWARPVIAADVEVYSYDGDVTPQAAGPLKAGDLTLDDVLRHAKSASKDKAKEKKMVPAVVPPQMSSTSTKPSVGTTTIPQAMMTQGMKAAMVGAGASAAVATDPLLKAPVLPAQPKKEEITPASPKTTPVVPTLPQLALPEIRSAADAVPSTLTAVKTAVPLASSASPAAVTDTASLNYQPGQEPKDLGSFLKGLMAKVTGEEPAAPPAPVPVATTESAPSPSVAHSPTPSSSSSASPGDVVAGATAPKSPIDMPAQSGDTPNVSTKDGVIPSTSTSSNTTNATIAPVTVKPDEERTVNSSVALPLPSAAAVTSSAVPMPQVSAKELTPPKKEKGCAENIVGWTKSCGDVGYPADFVGEIKGETRSGCPKGTNRDVWVSNSCSAPTASRKAKALAQKSTTVSAKDVAAAVVPVPQPGAVAVPSDAPGALVQTVAASSPSVTSPSQSVEKDKSLQPQVIAGQLTHGSCGVVNGLAALVAPQTDLCASGEATVVVGQGPWRWTCKGIAGGMTVSCAAPVAEEQNISAQAKPTSSGPLSQPLVEDGVCGSSHQTAVQQAPATDLCTHGVASRVSGSGPWTWACSGSNGGRAAACTAAVIADGGCGSAHGLGSVSMPSSQLCSSGYASAVTGQGPWNWTCSGLNGGQAATCTAPLKANAVCGPSSMQGHSKTPFDGLCSVGTASTPSGNGPWTWTCSGVQGGASVVCHAEASVTGQCGDAHGAAVSSIPTVGLCTQGTATRVTGTGPWNWSCLGAHGGDSSSCAAPKSVEPLAVNKPAVSSNGQQDDCGAAAEAAPLRKPSEDLCRTGHAGDVGGAGPWSWTCTTPSGQVSHCSTLAISGDQGGTDKGASAGAKPKAVPETPPSCGLANGQGITEAPEEQLCSDGKASSVKGKGPWTWSCAKGNAHVDCSAPLIVAGVCGASNGMAQKALPATGLCSSGTPTSVQGNGPWLWSCVGAGGGGSVSCSSPSEAQTRVDGLCGQAATVAVNTAPMANLCDSGVPSRVYGEGPWTWTCSGLNGGIASSCATQKVIAPPPAPPGPLVNGQCGNANGATAETTPVEDLCATGSTSAVSGNGPWNWNCLGENGGMTVSCTALLQPPAPITGVCGTASGVPTLTTPKSGLCSAGISSAVSGSGPWTWSCSGTNGGSAVACVAPLSGGSVPHAGLPSLVNAGGEAPAPSAAAVARVQSSTLTTPKLPSGPLLPTADKSFPPSAVEAKIPDSLPLHPAHVPAAVDIPKDAQAVSPPADYQAPAATYVEGGIPRQDTLPAGNRIVFDAAVSSVFFDRGESNMNEEALAVLDKVTAVLKVNSALRITLTAYADTVESSPREARRLSLARALAVRDYLTSKGVSSARVDVRALGANVPSGDPDRVEIKAN